MTVRTAAYWLTLLQDKNSHAVSKILLGELRDYAPASGSSVFPEEDLITVRNLIRAAKIKGELEGRGDD